MPNPFHYRARIDRLWRRSEPHNPGYIRLKALNAIVRELIVPTPRAQSNYQMYLATSPYDVARHKLRDLYDQEDPTVPAPERGPVPVPSEQSPEEDDDPL